MSQEQQRPKVPSEACTAPLSVPPVEIPPTEEVLAKIKAALSAETKAEQTQDRPIYCQCQSCNGPHTFYAVRQVENHWYCDGCAKERELGRWKE